MKTTMKTRIIFGSAMIAAMVGLFLLDWWLGKKALPAPQYVGLPLGVFFVILMAGAFVEVSRFVSAAGGRTLLASGMAGSLMVAASPLWLQAAQIGADYRYDVLMILLGLVVLACFVEQMLRHRVTDAARNIASTLLGVLYLGICGAIILQMRLTYGVEALVLFLAAVKFTDIGAYFTGSFLGKHKMIPWLSPGKSWEGLAGGLATAAGVSILATWLMGIPMGPGQAAVFGAVVGALGQLADLCESLLKRSAGLKDSGSLVPQFGGVMDIIDSPLLSAPGAYLLMGLLMNIG